MSAQSAIKRFQKTSQVYKIADSGEVAEDARNNALQGAQGATIKVAHSFKIRRGGRVAEGAPLLREYGLKAHRGFESLSLRQIKI